MVRKINFGKMSKSEFERQLTEQLLLTRLEKRKKKKGMN
jgi:hypothetical protein